ncbi:hypothetical protein JXA56_04365 [Candidatus Micrarchaeota archaeon]|nr:hypothetical protein [Candidatus Micrarchaeota archaeon]
MAKVLVYKAEWCSWCHRVTDFLRENGVEFQEKDVDDPENARESMELSGQGGIPVTVIDDEVVIGFDVEKFRKLLNLK